MLGTVIDEDSDSASSSSSWAAADEGSRQLEAVAARLLAQSRAAIQNAQQTLQETATNCQANLQSLGALLQQVSMATANEYGMPRSGSTGSMQVVPWQRNSSGQPDSPSAANWDLVPRFFGEELPHPTNGTNMGSSSSLAVFAREANGQELAAADGADADAQVGAAAVRMHGVLRWCATSGSVAEVGVCGRPCNQHGSSSSSSTPAWRDEL